MTNQYVINLYDVRISLLLSLSGRKEGRKKSRKLKERENETKLGLLHVVGGVDLRILVVDSSVSTNKKGPFMSLLLSLYRLYTKRKSMEGLSSVLCRISDRET